MLFKALKTLLILVLNVSRNLFFFVFILHYFPPTLQDTALNCRPNRRKLFVPPASHLREISTEIAKKNAADHPAALQYFFENPCLIFEQSRHGIELKS